MARAECFPKSHNVQAALKKMGEEEVAERFTGFGSAVKPAYEPWVVARKPLAESSVARQVLATGTGALNIGESRIQFKPEDRKAYEEKRRSFASYEGKVSNGWKNSSPLRSPAEQIENSKNGRYPSNLLLSHIPPDENGQGGCVRVGEKRVKPGNGSGTARGQEKRPMKRTIYSATNTVQNDSGFVDENGLETVPAYECVRDSSGRYVCPVALLDEMSGFSKGKESVSTRKRSLRSGKGLGYVGYGEWGVATTQDGYGDQGGASRFFLNLPPEPDAEEEECKRSLADVARDAASTSASPPKASANTAPEDATTAPDGSVSPGFFYCPKSSRRERNAGLEGMPERLRLRGDLTLEEQEYVYRELEAAGVEL